ncbi:hypothetical protein H6G04_30050 [Calothrix membranacea FACHB-236]|nr:hypothetical protein [Calothrix membranacea FACHB-236]
MTYLSEKHKQLSQSQQSGLMAWFGTLPFDRQLAAIGLSLTVGIISGSMAWRGEASDRIYFCIQTPTQELKCKDKHNRAFRMTPYHWQQWERDGMPSVVIKNSHINPQGLVKASNPYKSFWAVGAFAGFALAGWMLRHLQDLSRQLAALENIAEKCDTAKAQMNARAELLDSYWDIASKEVAIQSQLDLLANDQSVTIQQAEILAETEIEVTKMDAHDALFEAQTAGMTEEQKVEYLKFLRQTQTPYLQGSQTLQGTIDPKDKVSGSEPPAIASEQSKSAWVQTLVKQTALIWGNQGGGKSWLARYVVKLKKEAGYKVIVLDPDSNRSEWRGVESYHSWSEIESQIRAYVDELESRLATFNDSSMSEEQWREQLWAQGKATALICEEATTYGDFIKDTELLEKFGKLALTKSRKQEMPITAVSHNNTQTCFFGIKGLYNLVAKMLQVECLAEVDASTLQPKSTGKARVKLDSSNEWLLVELPQQSAKINNFTETATSDRPSSAIDSTALERIWQLEFNLDSAPGAKDNALFAPLQGKDSSNSVSGAKNSADAATPTHDDPKEQFIAPEGENPEDSHSQGADDSAKTAATFTPLHLTKEQASVLIAQLKSTGLTQTQVIELMWQVRKGGNDYWKKARNEYRQITGE